MNVKKERDGSCISKSLSRPHSKTSLHAKKGQITTFIIVGVLLLFLFAGVMYLVKVTKKTSLLVAEEEATAVVPAEFQPIARYTENCLEQLGKRGLLILGQQGGYLYPDIVGTYSAADPTDADGLSLEPLQVPYWHYNKVPNAQNTIAFSSLQPKLYAKDDPAMSIEAQLARFVEEKLAGCIQEYAPFAEQGFDVETDQARSVEVHVGEEKVNFFLSWKVQAEKGEHRANFDRFVVRIPLRLKHYYELASKVAEAQQKYQFLESQMLSLLGSFASIEGKIPPMRAATFELAATKFWLSQDVEKEVKSIISSYVPLLQVLSARNLQYYEYPVSDLNKLYQQNYNNMIIPLEGAEDVALRFDYFGWKPYFDINDAQGLIAPESTFVSQWFFTFGMQEYYTTYDISYPVLITVDDPLAFNREGYQFMFALESNIRNNKRVTEAQTLPPPVAAFQESMACNPEQRNTEIVKTIVVDSFTKEPLDVVQIGFSIPNQDDCLIGTTDEQGIAEEKYPVVYGGVMSFIKPEYLTGFYPVDTYPLQEKSAILGYAIAELEEPVIELHKFKPIKVSVKKKTVGKCVTPLECPDCEDEGPRHCFFPSNPLLTPPKFLARVHANGSLSKYNDYYFPGQEEPLSDKESATLTLTRISDTTPNRFAAELNIPVIVHGAEAVEVKLVPGVYKVTGMLLLEQEVSIPKDKRLLAGGDFSYDIEETKFDKYINGQVLWETPETYLQITPDDLYTHEELTFYLPSMEVQDLPLSFIVDEEFSAPGRVIEDVQMMSFMGNVSQIVRTDLEPVWS